MVRAKPSPMAAEPFVVLPTKPERGFSNAQFLYYLRDCLQDMPSSGFSTSLLIRRETPRSFFMTPCGISWFNCTHQLACPCEESPNDCCLVYSKSALWIGGVRLNY
jgi:hypothetical protein